MLDMLILALGTPLGLTVTIPPELGVVLPLLAACSTSSFTVGPNTSDFALCWPPSHGDPPVERSWTPVPHRGVTFSSSCRSAFFILKQEMIGILLHFFIHSMSTLFTTFLLFLDCFAQIFFLRRTYSSFFFKVSTAAVSLASSSFEDGRTFPSFLQQAHITSHLLLNLFLLDCYKRCAGALKECL